MILLIDNYDSFSYNLYQLVGSLNPDIKVIRNDEMCIAEIRKLAPERIILSPGPGRPEDAGICIEVIKALAGEIPILGVCLGHQAICQTYGGTITYAKELMHGKQDEIKVNNKDTLFAGLPAVIRGARYHSLAAASELIPEELVVTAFTADGEVMAVSHREHPVYGLQFHPESILTPEGKTIIKNFLGGRKDD